MNDASLDTIMRSAADDVRSSMTDSLAPPPPFEPNRSTSPAIGVFAAAILIVGLFIGWSSVRGNSADEDPVRIDAVESGPDEDTPAPTADGTDRGETGEDGTTDESTRSTEPNLDRFATDLEPRTLDDLARPQPGESVVDPAFGTTITRVTNATDGERVVPVQAPAGAWNADELMVLLYRSGADVFGHVVYDASTFEQVAVLDISPNDIEQVFWDPSDPDLVLFAEGNALRSVSVARGDVDTVAEFEQCDMVEPAIGSAGASWDGALVVLTCTTESGDRQLLAHDRSDGTTSFLDIAQDEQGHASPSGAAVVVETDTGFTIRSSTLDPAGSPIAWESSGASLTAGPDGETLIVGSGFEADHNGAIVTADLNGQIEIVVGPDTGYPSPAPGTRVAASAWSTPGLIVAASPTPSDGIQQILEGELVVADIRSGDPVVYRLAHTRTSGEGAFASAFISISPSGRAVLFSSDWGGGAIDTYLIQLG